METLKKLSKTNLVLVVSHDLEIAERFADRILRLVDGKLVEDVTLSDKEITANVISDDGSITVKSGAQLTDAETASLVNAIREKKKINLVESLCVRAKEKTAPIKAVHPETPASFVNSKMKLKSSMGLGVNSLKAKPFRLIITIILSVFAFALFGIFDTVASFNNTKATANLLRSGDYASITAQSQYANEYGASDVRLSQNDIDKINKNNAGEEIYSEKYSEYDFLCSYNELFSKYQGALEYVHYCVNADKKQMAANTNLSKIVEKAQDSVVIMLNVFGF
jgi:hypothetical protein